MKKLPPITLTRAQAIAVLVAIGETTDFEDSIRTLPPGTRRALLNGEKAIAQALHRKPR